MLFCGKHVFFSLGFVENFTGSRDHTYPMQVAAERVISSRSKSSFSHVDLESRIKGTQVIMPNIK